MKRGATHRLCLFIIPVAFLTIVCTSCGVAKNNRYWQTIGAYKTARLINEDPRGPWNLEVTLSSGVRVSIEAASHGPGSAITVQYSDEEQERYIYKYADYIYPADVRIEGQVLHAYVQGLAAGIWRVERLIVYDLKARRNVRDIKIDARDLQYELYEKAGRMVPTEGGTRLSLYCVGTGGPTVVLESGFGGGTYATWYELQPLLGRSVRTCSYDRAGYGFSELGDENLPRDLRHAVAELHTLLANSGEPRPYILAGHSNGGLLIGAYAKLYPDEVAGLVFLDAAVALPDPETAKPAADETAVSPYLKEHLASIRRCAERAEKGSLTPAPGDECLEAREFDPLPPAMKAAAIANQSQPKFWRAYLSEAEQNYGGTIGAQARALLPHEWREIPVRVFHASTQEMTDAQAAKAFGLPESDKQALAEARQSRAAWEKRQARVCELASDCQVYPIATNEHLVHNADPRLVSRVITQLVSSVILKKTEQSKAPPRAAH